MASPKLNHQQHYWNKSVGATQTHIYSLKADYPISVEIIGNKNPAINLTNALTTGDISVNVTGGIRNNQNLAGNITVSTLNSPYGEVKLTAQGDIKQTIKGTSVNAQNIKLDSLNGSINLQIESNNQAGVKLSAISAAAKGNIKLTKTDAANF